MPNAKATVKKAQPMTISSSDLDFVRSLATRPIKLKGAESGASVSDEARRDALSRREYMQKLDTEKLREKVSKGDADEEQVEVLVSELSRHVMTTAAAQKILSLERRGKVEMELNEQLRWKSQREREVLELEALSHAEILEQQKVSIAKDAERANQAMERRLKLRSSLKGQLAEREYQKMVEEEAKALEGEMMLARERDLVAKAAAAREAKREAAKRGALEVAESNRMFAARDQARRDAEEEEARQVAEYTRAKVAREREAEANKAAEKAAKEAVEGKLRAAQARVSAAKEREDDGRERAYWEKLELAKREEARAEAVRKEQAKKECFEAISKQLEIRAMHEEEARLLEREEVEAAKDFTEKALARERAEKDRKRAVAIKAMNDLIEQKKASERAAELERRRPLEEARKQKLVELAQERVVERFKSSVTQRMKDTGLPQQYVAAAKKVSNGLL